MLPFTTEQFFDVFEEYNEAVWPMQPVLSCVGILAVVLAVSKQRFADVAVSTLLGCLWLWMGIAYHIGFFSAINPAAVGFGIVFVVQGLLFFYAGAMKNLLAFGLGKNWSTGLGAGVLLYALLVYPLLGLALGHAYPRQPTFGVPCPTTIFTFGLLLWTEKYVPGYLLIIPLLWAVIGSSAAFLLDMWEDLGLAAAGIIAGTTLVCRKQRQSRKNAEAA